MTPSPSTPANGGQPIVGHTKLPWNVRDHTIADNGTRHIWVEGGDPIGETRAGPYKRQILEDEDYDEKAADAQIIVEAVNSHASLKARIEELEKALAFYADPESYHAIAMLGDQPCGEFAEDFSEDEWTKECGYNRPMPGKRARAALQSGDAK